MTQLDIGIHELPKSNEVKTLPVLPIFDTSEVLSSEQILSLITFLKNFYEILKTTSYCILTGTSGAINRLNRERTGGINAFKNNKREVLEKAIELGGVLEAVYYPIFNEFCEKYGDVVQAPKQSRVLVNSFNSVNGMVSKLRTGVTDCVHSLAEFEVWEDRERQIDVAVGSEDDDEFELTKSDKLKDILAVDTSKFEPLNRLRVYKKIINLGQIFESIGTKEFYKRLKQAEDQNDLKSILKDIDLYHDELVLCRDLANSKLDQFENNYSIIDNQIRARFAAMQIRIKDLVYKLNLMIEKLEKHGKYYKVREMIANGTNTSAIPHDELLIYYGIEGFDRIVSKGGERGRRIHPIQ